ncbi:ATPase [Mycolicibacterium fortuitum]|uniref:ATPase n=1 Tax=Mycolicibacterium fortuitum TaxID=1766 RepID=A0A378WEZ4_MYCFO|nr:ATPase [Mycolicibacterium fortuitum]
MSVLLGNMLLNNTIRPDVAVRYAKPGKGPIDMTDTATVVTVIDACARAGVPTLLISPPGQGKSSLVRSLAEAQGVACETVLGSLREPSDFAGLPIVGEDGVRMEPPAWAKRLDAAGIGILFLDELGTCPPSVQNAMLAVVLDRVVGDLQLPSDVAVVAGMNPPEYSGAGYELPAALRNRFCHLKFAPTVDEWLDGMATGWAASPASRAGVDSPSRRAATSGAVSGFISLRPDLLDCEPERIVEGDGPYHTRRSWKMVADVLAYLRADDTAAIQAVTFGLLGDGVGAEFLSWLSTSDLPDPEAVIADPAVMDWKAERPDRVWAVLTAVTTLAAQAGTLDMFRKAWGPLVAAAEAGAPDVAAAAARRLAKARPAKAPIPRAARNFAPMLRAAGLLDAEVA